jgi:hypothetical protein
MTRTHIVHAVSNLVTIGLLTVFMLMFLALFFGCQAPATPVAESEARCAPQSLGLTPTSILDSSVDAPTSLHASR